MLNARRDQAATQTADRHGVAGFPCALSGRTPRAELASVDARGPNERESRWRSQRATPQDPELAANPLLDPSPALDYRLARHAFALSALGVPALTPIRPAPGGEHRRRCQRGAARARARSASVYRRNEVAIARRASRARTSRRSSPARCRHASHTAIESVVTPLGQSRTVAVRAMPEPISRSPARPALA